VVPPATLPELPGLLQVRRSMGELRLTIAAAGRNTHEALRVLGAVSIEEIPVGFDDALVGYLGDRREKGFFLEDTTALEIAGGSL